MEKQRIEKKLKRKTNKRLVKTIILCKKNEKWLEVANLISTPKRRQIKLNLDEINSQAKENDTIVVPGKILGNGEIDKKIKIIALGISKTAEEKLKKAGIKIKTIDEEIKENPEAKNVKILRWKNKKL